MDGDPVVRRVRLPVGLAFRTEHILRFSRGAVFATQYDLKLGPNLYSLVCSSLEPSPDGWLSVVSSLEVLPDAATGVPPVSRVREGGRIEHPEHGFAITLPYGWTVEEPAPEATATGELDDPGAAGYTSVLSASSLRPDNCVVSVDDPVVRGEPFLLADYIVRGERDLTTDGDVRVTGRTVVHLAAGPAWRLDYVSDEFSGSAYFLKGPAAFFGVMCAGYAPPADRWLGVADTLELLPDALTGALPEPSVFEGRRVRRPADGFAVTFPDGWMVEEVTPAADALLNPEWKPEDLMRQATVLWADQPDSEGACLVVDFTRLAQVEPPWTSLREATEWLRADVDLEPSATASRHSYLDLPAGRAGRIDASDGDGLTTVVYVLRGRDAWMYLMCGSDEPPGDRWRSIARSFRFLPVDQPAP